MPTVVDIEATRARIEATRAASHGGAMLGCRDPLGGVGVVG
jgi:hypothetical protein